MINTCAYLVALIVIQGSQMREAQGGEQIFLQLEEKESYGSGGSISDDLYAPGGIPGIGLYVGNPNDSVRNDRVLLKYDLFPLLLRAGKIERAELKFAIDYYMSPAPNLDMEVQQFSEPVEKLTGPELNRSDVQTVGLVTFTADDAAHGADGSQRPAVGKVLDVTEVVKEGLNRGLLSSVFRLRVPAIEAHGAHQVQGLVVAESEGKRPVLEITLKD